MSFSDGDRGGERSSTPRAPRSEPIRPRASPRGPRRARSTGDRPASPRDGRSPRVPARATVAIEPRPSPSGFQQRGDPPISPKNAPPELIANLRLTASPKCPRDSPDKNKGCPPCPSPSFRPASSPRRPSPRRRSPRRRRVGVPRGGPPRRPRRPHRRRDGHRALRVRHHHPLPGVRHGHRPRERQAPARVQRVDGGVHPGGGTKKTGHSPKEKFGTLAAVRAQAEAEAARPRLPSSPRRSKPVDIYVNVIPRGDAIVRRARDFSRMTSSIAG